MVCNDFLFSYSFFLSKVRSVLHFLCILSLDLTWNPLAIWNQVWIHPFTI